MPFPVEMSATRSRPRRVAVAGGFLFLVLIGVLAVRSPFGHRSPSAPLRSPLPEVARTNLFLVGDRLHLLGRTEPFRGFLIERYPDGTLRSRSAISNGVLHGVSQGWYTNGQLQVSEHFKDGVSHGLRTKWSLVGAKISEASIVEGQLHGPFRKWHENGVLSERVEFVHSQPDGISVAYFSSGSLKTRAVLRQGKVVEQKFWRNGEFKE